MWIFYEFNAYLMLLCQLFIQKKMSASTTCQTQRFCLQGQCEQNFMHDEKLIFVILGKHENWSKICLLMMICFCFTFFLGKFLQLCMKDPRCKKLQLTDLLVSPVQHIMKVPLILKDIQSRTNEPQEKEIILQILEIQETSIRKLSCFILFLFCVHVHVFKV